MIKARARLYHNRTDILRMHILSIIMLSTVLIQNSTFSTTALIMHQDRIAIGRGSGNSVAISRIARCGYSIYTTPVVSQWPVSHFLAWMAPRVLFSVDSPRP